MVQFQLMYVRKKTRKGETQSKDMGVFLSLLTVPKTKSFPQSPCCSVPLTNLSVTRAEVQQNNWYYSQEISFTDPSPCLNLVVTVPVRAGSLSEQPVKMLQICGLLRTQFVLSAYNTNQIVTNSYLRLRLLVLMKWNVLVC